MLRAIIFDFNGVIIDDEPLHFRAFKEIFHRENIRLTKKDYYDCYLAMDDRSCIDEILRAHDHKTTPLESQRLRQAKEHVYDRLLKTDLRLFPGAVDFICSCATRYPLAIASGALRSEIQFILKKFRLADFFQAVVSADDVVSGKPDPETFHRAHQMLNRLRRKGERKILAGECVVIEDSHHGIDAAHEAGMKCVAVAHSYPLRSLGHADLCARSIASLQLSQLEAIFSGSG